VTLRVPKVLRRSLDFENFVNRNEVARDLPQFAKARCLKGDSTIRFKFVTYSPFVIISGDIIQVPLTKKHIHSLNSSPFLGAFAKLRKATISFIMSVCPYAWSNTAPTGRILMKLDFLASFEYLCRKEKFH
jgi:hypothetical protein